jgi:hypothetical protein
MLGSASVGQNLQTVVTVTLSQAAPSGGLPVTVTSNNPLMALVAGRPVDSGLGSLQVTIPEGTTVMGFVVQGLVSDGTVSLGAAAPNYTSGIGTITLTPSGFVLAGPDGLGALNFTTSPNVNTTLSVSSARLNSSRNFVELQQIRGGFSVPVQVNSSNPTVGTVAPSLVTFSSALDTVTTQFTALNSGSTDLIAGVPTDFSVPNQNRIVNAIVNPAGLSLVQGSPAVGKDLQTEAQAILSGPPAGPIDVTVASQDSGVLLLSKTPTGPGSPSITMTLQAGFTVTPVFYLQALANSGSANYRASAPGFGEKIGTVSLAPSGVVIAGPFGVGAPSFPTTPGAPNTTITVHPALLDQALNYVGVQPVRGGLSVDVAVTSSNQLVGRVTNSPVTIASGSDTATTEFDPLNAGTTALTAEVPPGFSAPAQNRQVAALVSTPGLSVPDGETIGQDLQIQGEVVLGQAAPTGGLQVTLTSSNESLLTLSSDPNLEGSRSITINIPANGYVGSFYLQGRTSLGTVTYTAEALGYGTRTGVITLAPSGIVLAGPIGLDLPFFYASVASGPVPLIVYTAQLYSGTNTYATVQSLRGGLSVTVSHTNTNPAVGLVAPASVTIGGGSNSAALSFGPLTPGATMIQLGRPPNFGVSADKTSLMGTVVP